MKVSKYLVVGTVSLSIAALAFVGCGGGGGVLSSGGTIGGLDSFTFQIVGTAQNPVTIYSGSGAVTGISGASFTDLAVTDRFLKPIVYVSDEDGDDEIFVMTRTGTLRTKITNNTNADSYPKLSPDGSKILFASDRSGNNDIYVMNVDGTGVTQLTTSPSGDREPSWSPDGTKFVFASARDGSYEIYTANASGVESGVLQITNGGADTSANSYPTWSPDGTKLAYHSNRLAIGNYECFIKNSDGTGTETNITNNSALDQYPSWSPDGSRLVLASQRAPSTGYDIWTINAATGGSALQLQSTAGTDWEPAYSADGLTVYFSSSRDDVSAPISYELYSVPASGGTETRLTTDTDTSQEKASNGFNFQTKLIGLDGRLGTGAAGFLYGQSGSIVTSILTFDTVGSTLAGRAAARIVANSPGDTSLSNLFFTLTTTVGITSISYYNIDGAATLFPKVMKVTIPSGTTNALISYSGTGSSAGQVVSILPYTANRSATKVSQVGETVSVEGTFPALYNAKGENIAPRGASEVRYDAKTGEVISFK